MELRPDQLGQFVQQLAGAQSALYACIRTLMAGSSDVADVLQETNRVLWQQAAEYDSTRPFLPWAYRIAQFQVLAHRKRKTRDRLVFDDELIGQLVDDLIQQSSSDERLLQRLESCLTKLPVNQRELVRARYEHGESVNAIARRLETPVNAVSAMLYRIRNVLAECLNRSLSKETL